MLMLGVFLFSNLNLLPVGVIQMIDLAECLCVCVGVLYNSTMHIKNVRLEYYMLRIEIYNMKIQNGIFHSLE